MNIGQLVMEVVAGTTQLEPQVVAAAQKAGDAGGKTLGQRLSKNMGRAIAGGIGTIFGAGFAIATKGAADLDAATQQLIADTGLTGAAAEEAGQQLGSLYRGNLQGYAAIGDALAKVHTDLGLTGKAAGDTTDLFLKFSTATGQDAAEAVAQADDTLDAFNLTAADAGPLLDKLVVSHQKWGGSISENEAALAKIAPALTSFGLGLDDGIGLLNLFNAAGIDASKVPTALAAALKKVKSPAEFRKLLKDIADTKDPFERAQKAIALFGARAGPQLAQALSQGNLDDFIVSMDEARGATEKAADAVESGWGNRFQLLLKNAGGALAEFGKNFGPLLMVGAQIGPKLGTAIAGAIGGLASVVPSGIKAALGKLGSMLGLKVATTMGAEIAGEAGASAVAKGVAGAGASSAVGAAAGGIGGLIASTMMAALTAALIVGLGVAVALALDKAFPGLAKQLATWFNLGLKKVESMIATAPPAVPATSSISMFSGTGKFGPGPKIKSSDSSHPGGKAAGGSVWANMPTLVGERGPELFVPRASGRIVPNSQLASAIGGSNTTINVPITGLVRARDPFEIATQVKRVADFLVLTPRREPA